MTDEEMQDDRMDAILNAGLAGASADVVGRFGSAIKEHEVAYSGIDFENGRVQARSLKGISKYKVNPDSRATNLKQQAGFSAEVKETARQRAAQAISGKKPTVMRTDDIPGHVNDPLYDITCKVDRNGNPVPGASVQMKFIGNSPPAAVDKMLGKDFQKYFDNDCKMMVPSDYYDAMKSNLGERISSLEEQIKVLKKQGKLEAAARRESLLRKCRQLDKNLVKSSVSNKEAMLARTNPMLSTAKDIVSVAHSAGVQQAKTGAAVGGGFSVIKNAIDCWRGKKSAKDAVFAVVGDTTSAAAVSYGTAFVGSAIKGTMQNSASRYVRTLSKTNIAAYVVSSTLEAGKTLTRYFNDEIDGVQCLNELGEKGYGMVTSSLFAAVGQMAIPIPVVGALAGSMIGYALSSASYKILSESLRNAKLAHERRLRIEAECEASIESLRECRMEMEAIVERYLREKRVLFDGVFADLKTSLDIRDVDGYISAANRMTVAFGGQVQFSNMREFDRLMRSDEPIVL